MIQWWKRNSGEPVPCWTARQTVHSQSQNCCCCVHLWHAHHSPDPAVYRSAEKQHVASFFDGTGPGALRWCYQVGCP
jgi:hypothetical protein